PVRSVARLVGVGSAVSDRPRLRAATSRTPAPATTTTEPAAASQSGTGQSWRRGARKNASSSPAWTATTPTARKRPSSQCSVTATSFAPQPPTEATARATARNAVAAGESGDLEKLSKATGGRIIASVKDLTKESLGDAKLVEEVKIGEDKLIYVRDAKNPKAVTIVVRGGTEHVVDEAERSLHDALSVVRNAIEDGKIVAGGGAPEAELAKRLREYAVKV